MHRVRVSQTRELVFCADRDTDATRDTILDLALA